MSDQPPSVRVVQCPKCGSPVEAGRPGAITSCSYCGSPLQVSVGASGHPIARLANIETSTVYLARAEQVRRAREQLAETDVRILEMREVHDSNLPEIKEVRISRFSLLWLWTPAMFFISVVAFAYGNVTYGSASMMLALVLMAVLWSQQSNSKARISQLEREQHDLVERLTRTRAERDRLAARIAELETGLDELADQP